MDSVDERLLVDSTTFHDENDEVSSNGEAYMDSDERKSDSSYDEDLSTEDDSLLDLDDEGLPWSIKKEETSFTLSGHAKLGMKERVEMMRLRKEIDDVNLAVNEQEAEVEEIRRELRKCRDRIIRLEMEKEEIEKEIERKNSSVALQRLGSQVAKLEDEIIAEKGVEQEIKQSLNEAEFRLNEVAMLHSSYMTSSEKLAGREKAYEEEEREAAAVRLENEYHVTAAAEANQRRRRKEHADMVRLYEERRRVLMDQAKESQAKASRFLQETLERVKRKESEEELARANQLKEKINSLIRLKRSIRDNRDSLKALNSIAKMKEREEMREEMRERKAALQAGLNPDEVILKKRQLASYQKQQTEFRKQQRQNEVAILTKLANEEKIVKSRQKRADKPHWQNIWESKKSVAASFPDEEESVEEVEENDRESFIEQQDSEIIEYTIEDEKADENIVQEPEIDTEDFDESIRKRRVGRELTAMESGILRERMSLLKANATHEQIAAGRKFKGVAFKSDPEEIVFKDFVIGNEMKVIAVLTNVSYTVNYVRFVRLSDELEDVIQIQFPPPGPLSAGMTCQMIITFTPQNYVDICGSIYCESQTGPVAIPLYCWTKKSVVVVSSTLVDFPITCLGEKRVIGIRLANSGSLATKYEISELNNDEMKIEVSSRGAEIEIIENSFGVLEPGAEVKIPFRFKPLICGECSKKFQIGFSDPGLDKVIIEAMGLAVDIPIYVKIDTIDLRLCMLNRLYQSSVILGNRANIAQRVQFDVPESMRNHLEILPKNGLVQAESTFSAQLKFFPRDSLLTSSSFDCETGELDTHVVVHIADQARPASFRVRATVTSSDLEFDVNSIDFGICTIYESITTTITLANKSTLPQAFGFVRLPEFIDVQPNDGFGTLLPLETFSLDVTFSPMKPKEYEFSLTCKSAIGRDFTLSCRGRAVLPLLRLSANVVQFEPTALHNSRTARLFVENPTHSPLSEEVIQGHAVTASTAAFEFRLPDDIPINVSPITGILQAGQTCSIDVTFSPRFEPGAIEAKANEMKATSDGVIVKESDVGDVCVLPQQQSKKKKSGSRKSDGSASKVTFTPSSSSVTVLGDKSSVLMLDHPLLDKSSDEYWEAYSTLVRDFDYRCSKVTIPCFVGVVRNEGMPPEPRLENTLYLEVNAPAVRPKLIVASNHGRTTIDFGQVCGGHQVVKTVLLKNISDESLHLSSSFLDSDGTFEVRNALRSLAPNQKHAMQVAFAPSQLGKCYEAFKIFYESSSLNLRFLGTGINPTIRLSGLDGDRLDMGDLLAGSVDVSTHTFSVSNTSSIVIRFTVRLDSAAAPKGGELSKLFECGRANCDGSPVFDVIPTEASIAPGESRDISVKFSPSQASDCYRDTARIEFSTQDVARSIRLRGRCWDSNVYTRGWETPNEGETTFSADISPIFEGSDAGKLPLRSVGLTFTSHGDGISREIEIGNIRSSLIKRPGGEFVFDPLPSATGKLFQIDYMKGNVDAGQKKTVSISFHPDRDCPSSEYISAVTTLTLRGEKVQQYRVILRGIVKCRLLGD